MSEDDKEQDSSTNKDNPLIKVDLIHHLLNNGVVCYLPRDFEAEHAIENLLDWMQNTFDLEALYKKTENIYFIEYKSKGGITGTLGLKISFTFFLLVDKQKVYFDIKPDKWFENTDNKSSTFNIGALVNESHEKEIKAYIFDSIFLMLNPSPDFKIDARNHYTEKISEQKRIWFCSHFKEDDLLLSFLEISSIKTKGGILNDDKNLKWYLVVGSSQSKLVSFNEREEEIESIILDNEKIKVKSEIGRNTIEINKIRLLSTRSNDDLFYQIQHINTLDAENKIKEIARLNWIFKKKNEDSNLFAITLIKYLIEKYKNPFDELSLLYMDYTEGDREKVFSEYTEDDKLLDLLHHILNYAGTNELLTSWIKNWEVSYIDSVAMNNLLIKAVEDAVQANNILPFHRFVRDNFLKKNKDVLNPIIFDITFSRHLIKCGLGKEAKKILKKRLDQLPDETISDLLPAKDIDLTGSAAGQIIKVTILEILSELETEKNAIDYKCQIARLQPLVEERIDKLIEISEVKIAAKAGEIKAIMNPNGLSANSFEPSNLKYNTLDDKLIDKYLRHPASRKGGRFSNFQKWIASIKIPDYSMLKSYSEKLSPQKHEYLNDIITDIKFALNVENLEVYISRGEKSVGINSFESSPQFLIIGGDHLDKNSAHYLNNSELRFAIGVEMAHLYFKHARITSSDVWKGALEKGYFLVDTVLSIIPAVGILGKSVQGISKLNAVSSFLQKTEKISKISVHSKEMVNTSEQIVGLYKSKFIKEKKDEDKEMEFLATLRIMQLTADRSAFIFTKNLNSAIRAMFLVSKRYYTELPVIEKYGLKEFLLKKNEDGSFQHQELAIRLASLLSFYISDEYNNVIKQLES